ncbi:hypothetical protein CSW24_06890, partial [Thermus scotoductus]
MAPFTSFGLGLGYQESPFALGLDLSSSGLWGFLEWQEAPFALRLEGRQEATGARLQLLGSYAFRFPVPEEATLALGGYEGSEGSFTYALGVGYRGGPTLGLRAGYVAPPFSLGGRLELGPAPSLAPFTSFGLGLGYQESPFALGLDLSSSGLWGFLEWQEAPFA